MREKWYLQTWFICVLFAFWFLIIPGFAGLVLLIMQILEDNKLKKNYGSIDSLKSNIAHWEETLKEKEQEYTACSSELNKKREVFMQELNQLKEEKEILDRSILLEHFDISEYEGLSSEECKDKLTLLRNAEKVLLTSDKYFSLSSSMDKKALANNKKQIIRCINAECDNILTNISYKNIDTARNKLAKCFESLNKIFLLDGIQLSEHVLKSKLEELNLVYAFELKHEQEREQQKAIREQMIEEEKVRREIERQEAKIEKDQAQCSNEINKLIGYMQKTESDVEKQLYIDKINELEEKVKLLEIEKELVLERKANARAGYVYIISNIGSFGEDVYKIGMTRRLEPMDRVKELSSASVPFEFDVHAMIFSDNAPMLETALHQKFEKNSVNRVNLRKEFFHVTLDEIETEVKKEYNNTATFTRIPIAREYNQTLAILEHEQVI